MMNQLQAVALNEGLRCKKKLWREAGREQLEAFKLAPWASQRRRDLLELLDRLNPTIAKLTQAIEEEVEKCPAARRMKTHPGVGPLTALAPVLIIGKADRSQCGKQIASYLGLVPLEKSNNCSRDLHSLPRALGIRNALVIVRLFHLLMLGLLAALIITFGLGKLAALGLIAVAALLPYEHTLVRHNDLSKLNAAFLTMNA
jgi:transposase